VLVNEESYIITLLQITTRCLLEQELGGCTNT